MAQHDYVIANQGFPAFRSDLNNALAAVVSNNSGATEPTTMFAHQIWVDTAADPSILKIRNADNDAWITIGTINQTADTFTLTSAVSATTLNTSGQVVFNDAGADVDFRVEGDTDANLLFVDASTDRVGVGTNAPDHKLHVAGSLAVDSFNDTTKTITLRPGFEANVNGGMGLAAKDHSGVAADGLGIFGTDGVSISTASAGTYFERMRIDSSGNLLVQTTNVADSAGVGFKLISSATAPSIAVVQSASTDGTGSCYNLYSTGAGAYRFYVGAGGTVFATNTSISGISDVRYKENIRDLDVGLAEVMQLQPRVFDWKEGKGKNTQNDRGFIAQEFEQVFPDLIDEWKDPAPEGEEPYKSVRQDLIPVLVKAIQELKAELDTVKAELATLKG